MLRYNVFYEGNLTFVLTCYQNFITSNIQYANYEHFIYTKIFSEI